MPRRQWMGSDAAWEHGGTLARDHPGLLVACGVLAGVLGGAYGMNGPPLAVYGALTGLSALGALFVGVWLAQ